MNVTEKFSIKMGRLVLATVLSAFGLFMLIGGVWLISLGGNWYYALAGVLSLAAALGLARRRKIATFWFIILFLLTLGWTILESGSMYWRWVPRFAFVLMLAIAYSLLLPNLHPAISRAKSATVTGFLVVAFVVAGGLAFIDHGVTEASNVPPASNYSYQADTGTGIDTKVPSTDWTSYGGSQATQRFSSAKQITPENVKNLELAWTAHVGNVPEDTRWGVQNTPIKVGDKLYVCGYLNKVVALNASTGVSEWTFDPGLKPENVPYTPSCRSLAYYADPVAISGHDGHQEKSCGRRIILGTLDGRVIELDAITGKRCEDFGNNGEVSITSDMGEVYKGYVAITSPPVVVRDTIVVGHETSDGQRKDSPSGVTKAFNVKTGELKWAWDASTPYDTAPRQGKDVYKRGSPNVWAPFSGDDKLGLVYLPVANASGDYFSSTRTPEELNYSPSLTALDIETGKPRWSFRSTNNDVWDYDAGSPPTLFDYPQSNGSHVPAIIFPTKTGEIFVLNRENGKPLFGVEHRAAPGGGIEPQARAKTQPYSKFNSLFTKDLTPESAWGLTPMDQLYCRIQYQQADYRGRYTPPRLDKPILDYPGYNGGSDWGGVSFDPTRGLIIANYNDMANYTNLVSREEANRLGWHAKAILNDPNEVGHGEGAGDPQEGLPTAVDVNPGWQMKFTGMVCKEPPYGRIRAIDVRDGRTVWDRPFGTARENGPFGTKLGLPINIGTPNNGGSVITNSGLIFIAAATDNLIRAIDINTGKTVWSKSLPAGAQAMPMIYEENGREYLVITATGHHFMRTPKGNYVLAYALPQ